MVLNIFNFGLSVRWKKTSRVFKPSSDCVNFLPVSPPPSFSCGTDDVNYLFLPSKVALQKLQASNSGQQEVTFEWEPPGRKNWLGHTIKTSVQKPLVLLLFSTVKTWRSKILTFPGHWHAKKKCNRCLKNTCKFVSEKLKKVASGSTCRFRWYPTFKVPQHAISLPGLPTRQSVGMLWALHQAYGTVHIILAERVGKHSHRSFDGGGRRRRKLLSHFLTESRTEKLKRRARFAMPSGVCACARRRGCSPVTSVGPILQRAFAPPNAVEVSKEVGRPKKRHKKKKKNFFELPRKKSFQLFHREYLCKIYHRI